MRRLSLARWCAVLFSLVLFSYNSTAQYVDNAQLRRIKSAALETISSYELYADVHDEPSKRAFLDLFVDDEVKVFSDLLDYAPGSDITVRDYVNHMSARDNVSLTLWDLSLEGADRRGPEPHLHAMMKKTVMYSRGDIIFSSELHYLSAYQIDIDLVYSMSEGTCKIAGISGSIDSDREPLADHFTVVQRNPSSNASFHEYDRQVLFGGKRLFYNNFDQAFTNESRFESWDSDVVVKSETIESTEDYDYIRLDYKSRHFRVRPFFGTTLGDSFKSITDSDNYGSSSRAIETGLDFGYSVLLSNKVHAGIFSGVRLNESAANLSYADSLRYSLEYYVKDGQNQRSDYTLTSLTEGFLYKSLVIPVYVGLEIDLYSKLRLSLDGGVKAYLNLQTQSKPFHVIGSVKSGNSVKEIDSELTSFTSPVSYEPKNQSVSFFGSAGLDYNFYNNIVLFGSIGYEISNDRIYEGRFRSTLLSDFKPLVVNGDSIVGNRSLMPNYTFSRQALWLNVGLKIKL